MKNAEKVQVKEIGNRGNNFNMRNLKIFVIK